MTGNSEVVRLGTAVLQCYAQLKPQTAEDRQVNEGLVSHLTNWFNSKSRMISDAAAKCCDQYLSSELDSASPGNRGLGRMTDFEPRFAAKHRPTFQRQPD